MIVNEANMGMLLEPKMKALLSEVDESLELDGGSVFCRSRILKLTNCGMKYICNTTNSAQGVFVDLKTLYIEGAEHLEELCHGNIPPASFVRLEEVSLINVPLLSCLWGLIEPPSLGNLAILKVHDGKLITSLVLRSSVKCFAQLRVLEIEDCPKLETIVSCDGQIEKDAVEDMPFKNLEELYLTNLDSLKTLYSEQEAPNTVFMERMVSSLKILVLDGCTGVRLDEKSPWRMLFDELEDLSLLYLPQFISFRRMLPEGTVAFQKLLTLSIRGCHGLRYLLTLPTLKMFGSLKELEIGYCEQMESIIGREEDDEVTTVEEEIMFSESCKLNTSSLPKLRIIPEGIVAFQKLLNLKIYGCNRLRYLLTPLMVRMFGSLKELEIEFCEAMESIIGREEDDEVATIEEEICFPELRKPTIKYLPKLRMVCSEPVDLSLPYWNKFGLLNCPIINRFCAGNMTAPELKQVSFLGSFRDDVDFVLDLETTRKWFKDCELGKCCLECARFKKMYARVRFCEHLTEGFSINKVLMEIVITVLMILWSKFLGKYMITSQPVLICISVLLIVLCVLALFFFYVFHV